MADFGGERSVAFSKDQYNWNMMVDFGIMTLRKSYHRRRSITAQLVRSPAYSSLQLVRSLDSVAMLGRQLFLSNYQTSQTIT